MPKTLVIDDDSKFESDVRAHFGAETDENFLFAHDDETALTLMRERTDDIDIAAVAIDSDVVSGMDIFRKLGDIKLRVPRVALSKGEDLGVIRTAMNRGAVDFLTKPVAMDDLTKTIDKVYRDCEERRTAWRNEAQLSAIRREIDIAGDLQKRILPDGFPSTEQLDVFAHTNPAKEMGGDFYDVFEIAPHKLALTVADVSGKGIPAAFLMAVVRTMIRSTAPTSSGPAACLETVNRLLCGHDIPGMFVSVFYAELDTQSWQITFASGGHLPPFLVHGKTGSAEPVHGGDGVVLGVDPELDYEQDSLRLQQGDTLFVYTDGLTEAFDSERNQFSEERLLECLARHKDLDARSMTDSVIHEVGSFTGAAPQSDDLTSLAIKRL